MNIKKIKAFTLVELIIVVAVLSILATIAFISYAGYAQSSRNAVRVADIKELDKVLDLYYVSEYEHPTPDNGEEITYSGSEVWTQGIFGSDTIDSMDYIISVPTDPLTKLEYTYSVLNNKEEYEIAGVMELGDDLMTFVEGNYNGQVASVEVGTKKYILAVPTIINGNMNLSSIEEIIAQKELLYDGYSKLPSNYIDTEYDNDWSGEITLVNEDSYVVSSGSILDLTDEDNQVIFLENLQDAYQATEIVNEPLIDIILSSDTANNLEGAKYVAQSILNENISTQVKVTADQNGGPINASCGSDDGEKLVSTPINLCHIGKAISFVDNGVGSTFDWSCDGINGGNLVSCTADHYNNELSTNYSGPQREGGYYLTETWGTTSRLQWCNEQGYLGYSENTLSIQKDRTYYKNNAWTTYSGSNGRVVGTLTCENHGLCGIDNGGSYSTVPTNLCKVGESSIVTHSGDLYSWSCTGINNSIDFCSANSDINIQEHTFINPTKNGRTIMQYGGDATSDTRRMFCLDQGYSTVASYVNGNYFGEQSTYSKSSNQWTYTNFSGGGNQIISITCSNI